MKILYRQDESEKDDDNNKKTYFCERVNIMKMMAYAILEGKIHQVKAEKIEIRYKRLFLYAHKRSGIPAKRQRNIQRK